MNDVAKANFTILPAPTDRLVDLRFPLPASVDGLSVTCPAIAATARGDVARRGKAAGKDSALETTRTELARVSRLTTLGELTA